MSVQCYAHATSVSTDELVARQRAETDAATHSLATDPDPDLVAPETSDAIPNVASPMSLRPVRSQPPGLPTGFLLRLVDRDLGFVRRDGRRLIPGAIVCTRCVALPNQGALLDALRTLRIPFLVDPDTPVLAEVDPDNTRAAWLRAMPSAASITSLPIVPDDLADAGAVETFARAVASPQRGAAALSAGYFRVDGPDDPWRDVNSRLSAANEKLAAGRPTCAWFELTLEALRDRVLVDALAADYRSATFVALRIAGLRAAGASEEDAVAVLAAVRTLRGAGPRVILDSIGTLGAAAMPLGAHGFSGGGSHHRSVPVQHVLDRAPSSTPLGYEVPLEFRQVPRDDALADRAAGTLEACPETDCTALDPDVPKSRRPASMRTHFVHAADADGRFAGFVDARSLASEMQQSPEPGAQAWGRALERLADEDADAASTHSPR